MSAGSSSLEVKRRKGKGWCVQGTAPWLSFLSLAPPLLKGSHITGQQISTTWETLQKWTIRSRENIRSSFSSLCFHSVRETRRQTKWELSVSPKPTATAEREELFSYQLWGWGSLAAAKHKHFTWRNWEVEEPGEPRVSQDHQIGVAQLTCWRLVRVLRGVMGSHHKGSACLNMTESNGVCNRGDHSKTNHHHQSPWVPGTSYK